MGGEPVYRLTPLRGGQIMGWGIVEICLIGSMVVGIALLVLAHVNSSGLPPNSLPIAALLTLSRFAIASWL